jgi:hypothetical protein
MTTTLAVAIVLAVIVGIFLRSVFHALGLIGLVTGFYLLTCYAFDISPRALLNDTVHAARSVSHEARHEYRAHRSEIEEWL